MRLPGLVVVSALDDVYIGSGRVCAVVRGLLLAMQGRAWTVRRVRVFAKDSGLDDECIGSGWVRTVGG